MSKDERRIQALRDAITAERTGVLPEEKRTDSEPWVSLAGLITGAVTATVHASDFGFLTGSISPEFGMMKSKP